MYERTPDEKCSFDVETQQRRKRTTLHWFLQITQLMLKKYNLTIIAQSPRHLVLLRPVEHQSNGHGNAQRNEATPQSDG